MKKKISTIILSLALTASLLTGCGSSSNNTSENVLDFSNTTLTGFVTAVDGSKITLSMSGGMGGNMMGGKMNTDTSSDNSNDSNQTPPDIPSGSDTPPDMPAESSDNTEVAESNDTSSDTSEATQNSSNDNKNQNTKSDFNRTSTTFVLNITDESVIQDASLSDITQNTMLTITFGDNNTITSITITDMSNTGGDATPDNSASDTSSNTGTSATTISEDTEESDVAYTSSSSDENALRLEGNFVYTGNNITVNKESGDTSDTEGSDFYGLNAGVLSLSDAQTTLNKSSITTNAKGANGIFAYGENSTVTVSDTSITTSADNSGGIDVTGGATINASNLTIETSGNSSAAIRSDRGGGTLNVSQGTYTTNGTGSPSIYCTANITVADATLNANASEGVVIEGNNNVTLENCDVTGNMQGTYQGDENENLHAIMIYQSMSGDADEGEGTLTVNGGSITSKNGDLIYSTNTNSTVTLNNVDLTLANDTLLQVCGNDGSRGWGNDGSNGASMSLFATKQELPGNILVDEISSLSLSLSDESHFTGSINSKNEGGEVNVSLDDESTWDLTSDSYITSYDGNMDNINTNGYTLYINGIATK